MRQLSCPVCNTLPTLAARPLSKISCNTCGVHWTYLPEEVQEDQLYRDEVYAVVDNRQSIFEKIIFSEAKKVLLKAKKLNPNSTTLLDFGSGKGQFLAVAKSLGWKGLGIETEEARANFARTHYQTEVLNYFYQSGKVKSGNFDLITLNHVLEHLPQPMELLNSLLEENLSATGLIYIEVPRADSWQAAIAGENWIHWDIPRHLTHWTESGLLEQLHKIGFEMVDSRSFSIHLGVLGMLQAFLSTLGFRENLILRLKRKKSPGLLLSIGFLLPFAWILEWISAKIGKSGILGIYLRRNG
jgi:SAM-dependent methyltransferase